MINKCILTAVSVMLHFTLIGQVNPSWSLWLENNSYPLTISDIPGNNNLHFLREVLKDKKIVFLGEDSHGVSEFTLLKTMIIKYLHDSLNFDVLAFETNCGDAFSANLRMGGSGTGAAIHNSISALWQVEEIKPLFDYIIHTHSTKEPLNLAGVDFILSNGITATGAWEEQY
jgi:erythromycin esterase